jgi:hypothetical protein
MSTKLAEWVSLKPFEESHAPPPSAIKPIEYSLKCRSIALTLRSVAARRGQYKGDEEKALHAERFFPPASKQIISPEAARRRWHA